VCSRFKNSDRVCVPAIKELLHPAVDEFSPPSVVDERVVDSLRKVDN